MRHTVVCFFYLRTALRCVSITNAHVAKTPRCCTSSCEGGLGDGGEGGSVSLDRPLGGDQELGRAEEREEHRDDVTSGKTWRM